MFTHNTKYRDVVIAFPLTLSPKADRLGRRPKGSASELRFWTNVKNLAKYLAETDSSGKLKLMVLKHTPREN